LYTLAVVWPHLNSHFFVCDQGLKKCEFPGKLVEISCGPQVEDDRHFMTSQKKFVFLKTLHSRALTITEYTYLDWFSLLASVHIQHVNSCIAAVYHATAWHAKMKYWQRAKPMEVANLHRKVENYC